MWKTLLHAAFSALLVIMQISLFSQLPFPFSAVSFPIIAIAYGIVRNRPLLAAGWALAGGVLLDLHGLLGFGAELFALFASFFAARFLFRYVVTNAGAGAFFLLAAAAAVIHWFLLSAIDGVSVLFGGVPVLIDLAPAAALAPVRQALANGLALLVCLATENALRRRYRKTFLSHAQPVFSRQ